MDDSEPKSTPTASENMFQKSTTNGYSRGKPHRGSNRDRHDRIRSKSECHPGSSIDSEQLKSHDIIGVVVKSSKDRAHDRKPKNLKGNGKPKKAGGGGKGTWGKNGMVYEEENEDPSDPNFDQVQTGDVVLQEVIPDLTSSEFDKVVTPIILDYFNHGITDEVVASLNELNITHLKHRVLYLTISLAMEKKGAQRELTSVLLSDLYGERTLLEQDFELGFQALMNALPDLQLDTPDAVHLLGQFLARCVADDCLRPCYIKEHLEHPSDISRIALETAQRLLRMKHGIVRLDNIWGYGGGIRPVKLLVKEIILLVKEYLSSKDLKEAERCIIDLDVPHFHHEIVFEALVIALEDGSEETLRSITELLKHLSNDTMITVNQMHAGFERVFKNMDDIILDSPRAYKYLDCVLEMCCRAGVIPLSVRQKAPTRGRKRFVSEGDFVMSPHRIFMDNGSNAIPVNGRDEIPVNGYHSAPINGSGGAYPLNGHGSTPMDVCE